MDERKFVTVTISGPTAANLITIVHALVEARLAACGNVIAGVTSIYRWKNTVNREPEALALLHTEASLLPQVEAVIINLHPYEVPQIVALPILAATSEYAAWLADSIQ